MHVTSIGSGLCLLFAASACGCTSSSSAEDAGKPATTLASYELPATTSHRMAKSPSSLHLALDGANAFYTTLDGDVMRVAKTGGTPPAKIGAAAVKPPDAAQSESCIVTSLVASGGRVYWSVACGQLDACEAPVWVECADRSEVDVAPEDGSAPPTTLLTTAGHVDAVAVAGSDVYATMSAGEQTMLWELGHDGPPLDLVLASFESMLAVDGDTVYWGGRTKRGEASEIREVTSYGAAPSSMTIASTSAVITSLAARRGDVYWTAESSAPGPVVNELDREPYYSSASGGEAQIAVGDTAPKVIAVDADGTVFGAAADQDFTTIKRCPDGAAIGRVDGMAEIRELAVDDTDVYFVDYESPCVTDDCGETKLVEHVGRVAKH